MKKDSKKKDLMFIHTSDKELIKSFIDKGIKPVSVVGDRYTFVYEGITHLSCDTYAQASYVINNIMTF